MKLNKLLQKIIKYIINIFKPKSILENIKQERANMNQGKEISISKLQQEFAYDVHQLIKYINDVLDLRCTLGEAYRTKEQAEIYAKQGKGISNSLHCIRLAIDLNLFDKDNNYLTKSEDYLRAGEFWKSLNSMNKWGGDFQNADGNHFSRSPDGKRG